MAGNKITDTTVSNMRVREQLTQEADWRQGHNHPLPAYCATPCPRWASHAPWQCDPDGGCPTHYPRPINHQPISCGPDCQIHNPTPPGCWAADCEFLPVHEHGPACTATCGVCHPDDDVVEALVIPARPAEMVWQAPVWTVALYHDGRITLDQDRRLDDDEIAAVSHAYDSARWFRDHLAELHIG